MTLNKAIFLALNPRFAQMNTKSILKQLLDSLFCLEIAFCNSFSTVVIENQYLQTSLMVARNLFRGKEGGPID